MISSNSNSYEALPALSAEQMKALAAEMDTVGFGVWHNAVSPSLLNETRLFIAGQLAEHEQQYFVLHGKQWLNTSPLRSVAHSRHLRSAVNFLWQHGIAETGGGPDSRGKFDGSGESARLDMAASLRVLTGSLGLAHSELYHYDSYVVTALVPVIIPNAPGESHGDLVMFPNLRPLRLNVFVNILEKIAIENKCSRVIWKMPTVRKRFGAKLIPMQPGNIYFFWGMRSLHANQACEVGRVRSTALFHFGDPHAGSVLKKLSGAHHRFKERRLRKLVQG